MSVASSSRQMSCQVSCNVSHAASEDARMSQEFKMAALGLDQKSKEANFVDGGIRVTFVLK